jgi:hypothetical protein
MTTSSTHLHALVLRSASSRSLLPFCLLCPRQQLRSAREVYDREQAILRKKTDELEAQLREQQLEQERLMQAKERRMRENTCVGDTCVSVFLCVLFCSRVSLSLTHTHSLSLTLSLSLCVSVCLRVCIVCASVCVRVSVCLCVRATAAVI